MSKFIKKSFTILTVVANMVWTMGVASFVPVAHAAVVSGSLIKASLPAVYYYGADSKRYVFPNEKTYFTWYSNFSGVQTISDLELSGIAIGGNVTFRPGVKLAKITTDPKVYAVDAMGSLRWITTGAIAEALYGANWGAMVQDVPDGFFVNYTTGADITAASQFDPAAVTAAASSINVDKGLAAGGTTPTGGTGGALTVALASDSPAGQSVPAGATPASNVVFAKINLMTGSNAVSVSKLTISRSGLSADGDLTAIKLWNGATQLDTAQTLNSSHTASFNVNLSLAANTTTTVTVTGDLCDNVTCPNISGSEIKLGVAANTHVISNASSVSGAPVFGNTMVATNTSVGQLTISQSGSMPAGGSTIDLGDTKTVFGVNLAAGSVEDVSIWSITFKSGNNSTINVGDLENIQLVNNTTGATVATLTGLNASGDAVYDLGASPLVLAKGTTREFILKAKAVNGSSRVIAFDINDGVSFLVKASGNLYGFGVNLANGGGWTGATGVGNGTTVNQGTVTVSKAASSPAAGNVAKGAADVVLGEFTFDIKGETVRFGTTVVDVTDSAAPASCLTDLDNIKLVDKATGNVLAGPVSPTTPVAGTCRATFSSSYELPAALNTVQVILNTNSAIAANTVLAASILNGSFANVRGLTSNKTITVAPAATVTANNQTVKGPVLVAQMGATPLAGNVVKGKVGYKVAYIGLDASTGGEDIRVSTLSFTNGGASETTDWTSARLINVATGAQVGQTVQPVANVVTFTFNGDELTVMKTAQVNLALQIDILSTACGAASAPCAAPVDASADTFTYTWTTVSGTGKQSSTAATVPASVLASPVQAVQDSGTLIATLDADTAQSAQLVSSSTSNNAVSYKFQAIDESAEITEVYLVGATTAAAANVVAAGWGSDVLSLDAYVNGVKVGSSLSASANGIQLLSVPAGTIVVPKDGSVVLTVKVNVQAKTNVFSGDAARLGIANSTAAGAGFGTTWQGATGAAADSYLVTATGQDSGVPITNINSTGAAGGLIYGGNVVSFHDGVLTVTLNASSPSGLKVASTNQELIRLNLTATGDDITINTLTTNIADTCAVAPSYASNLKSADGSITYVAGVGGATPVFTPIAPTALVISAGSTKVVKVEVNTANCANPDTIQMSVTAVNYAAVDGNAITGGVVQTKDIPVTGGAISY